MSCYKFNVGDRVKYVGPYAGCEEDELGTVVDGLDCNGHLRVRWDEDGCTRAVQKNNVVKQFPEQNPDEMTVGEFKKLLEQYADDVIMSKALSEIFNCSH